MLHPESRLQQLLNEAGLDNEAAPPVSPSSLVDLVDEALQLTGLSEREIAEIEEKLATKTRVSAAAVGIGAGFSAWSLTQSGPLFRKAFENGMKIGKFVHENLDTLTAGWEESLPEVAAFATEFILKLPSGTVNLAVQLVEFDAALETAVDLAQTLSVDAADVFDALGLAGDMFDLADAATSLGLGLLVGWLAKKGVQKGHEPIIKEKQERLAALRETWTELWKLRQALRTELPCIVVSGQLLKLDEFYWEL